MDEFTKEELEMMLSTADSAVSNLTVVIKNAERGSRRPWESHITRRQKWMTISSKLRKIIDTKT